MDFLFDLIEMVEIFVIQANSMRDRTNDVEHDAMIIDDVDPLVY